MPAAKARAKAKERGKAKATAKAEAKAKAKAKRQRAVGRTAQIVAYTAGGTLPMGSAREGMLEPHGG
jgi:hypothetical protein